MSGQAEAEDNVASMLTAELAMSSKRSCKTRTRPIRLHCPIVYGIERWVPLRYWSMSIILNTGNVRFRLFHGSRLHSQTVKFDLDYRAVNFD
jgi:hypothetical protein